MTSPLCIRLFTSSRRAGIGTKVFHTRSQRAAPTPFSL